MAVVATLMIPGGPAVPSPFGHQDTDDDGSFTIYWNLQAKAKRAQNPCHTDLNRGYLWGPIVMPGIHSIHWRLYNENA
jgi:hypothetical protein